MAGATTMVFWACFSFFFFNFKAARAPRAPSCHLWGPWVSFGDPHWRYPVGFLWFPQFLGGFPVAFPWFL